MSREFTIQNWIAPRAGGSPGTIVGNMRAARKCRADLYHVTGDIHYAVLALPPAPDAADDHDCIFLYSTKGWKRRILKWLFLTRPVRHCRLITTISQATKEDIITHTGCHPDKIVVIPNPVDGMIRHVPTAFNHRNRPCSLSVRPLTRIWTASAEALKGSAAGWTSLVPPPNQRSGCWKTRG